MDPIVSANILKGFMCGRDAYAREGMQKSNIRKDEATEVKEKVK
jgi:hypothetical protein